jgi:DNA-directed RNA polymerase subunit RPC12/RpoP
MADRKVRCPQCGGLEPDTEFVVLELGTGVQSWLLDPDDGTLVALDFSMHANCKWEIRCSGCGYQWSTKRKLYERRE